MATKPKTEQGTEIIPWQEEMARQAAASAQLEKPVGGKFVSFQGGVLTYNGAPVPGNTIPVVILDTIHEMQYYPNPYVPNQVVAPDCYAFSRDEATLAPHAEAEKKQAPTCAECPKSKWVGTGRDAVKPACKAVRRLALLPASVLAGGREAILGAEVVYAKIPVMSVKNYAAYHLQVANVLKRPQWGIVTNMSVAPDTRSMFRVGFSMNAPLSEDQFRFVVEKRILLGDGAMFPYGVRDDAQPGQPQQPAPKPGRPKKAERY